MYGDVEGLNCLSSCFKFTSEAARLPSAAACATS